MDFFEQVAIGKMPARRGFDLEIEVTFLFVASLANA